MMRWMRAWGDMDEATPRKGRVIAIVLMLLFVAAAMGDGPR